MHELMFQAGVYKRNERAHSLYYNIITCICTHIVFRYVPEELPEVELPDLATKKWTSRKRINSNHRDGE